MLISKLSELKRAFSKAHRVNLFKNVLRKIAKIRENKIVRCSISIVLYTTEKQSLQSLLRVNFFSLMRVN